MAMYTNKMNEVVCVANSLHLCSIKEKKEDHFIHFQLIIWLINVKCTIQF